MRTRPLRLIIKKGEDNMRIFGIYKRYKASYENSIQVIWKLLLGEENINIILKGHEKKFWPHGWVSDYAATMGLSPERAKKLKEFYDFIYLLNHSNEERNDDYVYFEYKNHQCKFYGVVENGKIANGAIVEIFFREEYRFLNPEKCIVIDIGANIADTAIYFALNDAEQVIALEPFQFSFHYATINVDANNMNDRIKILNAGYGKDSEVKVKDKISNAGDILEISNDGKKINIYSLGTLINMYSLNSKDNLLLKIDCEGCEYNLLDESIEVLRKFNRIEIEFHYGYKKLESKLKEAGFIVYHSKPYKSDKNDLYLKKLALANRDYTIGLIYAKRRLI